MMKRSGRTTSGWGQSGFTMIEILTVIMIIGIVLAIATLNFSQMQTKARIEKETREIFTDANYARTQAIFSKKPSSMLFQPQGYTFKNYSSENEDPAAGKAVSTQSVKYSLTAADGTSIANMSVLFDIRGVATNTLPPNPPFIIRINPTGSGAAFDCIIIDTARTNIGNMQNGACILK